MSGSIGNSIAIYLGISPIYLYISAVSLLYHSAVFNASREDIEKFFSELRFPLTLFFRDKPCIYVFFGDRNKSVLETIQETATREYMIPRVIATGFVLLIVIAAVRDLTSATNTTQIIVHGTAVVLNLLALYNSWRFGHKLSNTKR